METWNLESSGPPIPASSNYFTSILPPPATLQNEEIRMRGISDCDGNNEMEVVHSGHGHIRYEELLIRGVDSVGEERDRGTATPRGELSHE